MIIITGATGQLGSQIVDRLLEKVPARSVGVSVRDVAKATALVDRGVRVRAGDFTQPDSLLAAFEDAEQVLVVSAAIRGDGASAATRAAIDAALKSGASRILYTSHQAASPDSLFSPQPQHAAAEGHLASHVSSFTALRNGFYASTIGYYLGDALTSGRLVLPADGPVSWTAHADLADAAVAALTRPGLLDGVTPALTGSEALDFGDVASLLSDITGTTIERVVVDDEDWKLAAVEQGMPAGAADFTLGMFRAARRGEFAVVDPTLASLLGHPPTTVRSFLDAWARR